ncbi:hypothetical protein [Tuwongella immobilis]|uniref:Uncharacterized protein n=1 Tax=Tuwongella immobilis TaxID=692036 RepID=A0A6C2YS14_9BACT|nr:hypothetical protein [Tuwongella immobilis]VIP04266.1 Uncharacterized protein OS=Cystobacter fuscus DSM 2262 GN=D187_000023 PE=4 SV=1 [Tuwongella immobilis]VTS05895.1 Uncharacterized protein OS=Cystobacter fuscus DSM 2262 GN=D187_000023 PE=4 SV=1 [Tuwongella immobilis]
MYTSLDRIDIVTQGPDGRHRFIQTDHRSPEEIEQEPELSVLYALIRILNPRRATLEGVEDPIVVYHTQHPLPRYMRQTIRSAGGELMLNSEIEPWNEGDVALDMDAILESTMESLAEWLRETYHLTPDVAGLSKLEHLLAERSPNSESDEVNYWASVIYLGCYTGELIRKGIGGQWITCDSGTLPIALETTFREEPATVNPLGKAIKRFDNGPDDSPVGLVKMLLSQTIPPQSEPTGGS